MQRFGEKLAIKVKCTKNVHEKASHNTQSNQWNNKACTLEEI